MFQNYLVLEPLTVNNRIFFFLLKLRQKLRIVNVQTSDVAVLALHERLKLAAKIETRQRT